MKPLSVRPKQCNVQHLNVQRQVQRQALWCMLQVVFVTINTLLQTTSAARPDSVLTFPGFWATAAVLGLTLATAWGGCASLPVTSACISAGLGDNMTCLHSLILPL